MSDREDVVETVNRLFIATDRKDWAAVQELFADRVHFDMTSLTGGTPATLSGEQIAAGWREGLKDVPALQHQAGNYLVTVGGEMAEVFCYATATHFHPEREKKLTQFYGSYELRLVRARGGHWRIHRFKFDKKFVVEL